MYGRGNFRMSGLKLLSLANENLFSLIQFSIFSLKIYKLSLREDALKSTAIQKC